MSDIFFLGQAPPRAEPSRPFGRTSLYRWLDQVAISDDILARCNFGALVSDYPGSKNGKHLPPSPVQIQSSRPALVKVLQTAAPRIVIPLGILAIREVLDNDELTLSETIGTCHYIDPFACLGRNVPVIPLPHPSRANPWVHLGDNGLLLTKALDELKAQISGLG